MECAGIAEAGGVKDVTFALAKGFSRIGHKVTLFIPAFGCTSYARIKNLKKEAVSGVEIPVGNMTHFVSYTEGIFAGFGFKVVFVENPIFSNKSAVYVYTEKDQKIDPKHIKGKGHEDSLFIDAMFSKAVSEYVKYIPEAKRPDIMHCQDASCALIPCYADKNASSFYEKTKFFVTIHNAGPAYHHDFMNLEQAAFFSALPYSILIQAQNGYRVEPFLLSAVYSRLTTVSTFYAEELTDPENDSCTDGLSTLFFKKKIPVHGITNGIDYNLYNPMKKHVSLLPYAFSPAKGFLYGKLLNRRFFLKMCRKFYVAEKKYERYMTGMTRYGWIDDVPDGKGLYFMYHGRIVMQKGISVILDSLGRLFADHPESRIFIVGQGDPNIEESIKLVTEQYPGKIVFFNGYNDPVSRLVAAASDFVFLPSFFEPCCLEDFIAQIYGTIPIAHATGGLKKIVDGKSGFLYSISNADGFLAAVDRAVMAKNDRKNFKKMIAWAAAYVLKEYSWNSVIQSKYIPLFCADTE